MDAEWTSPAGSSSVSGVRVCDVLSLEPGGICLSISRTVLQRRTCEVRTPDNFQKRPILVESLSHVLIRDPLQRPGMFNSIDSVALPFAESVRAPAGRTMCSLTVDLFRSLTATPRRVSRGPHLVSHCHESYTRYV